MRKLILGLVPSMLFIVSCEFSGFGTPPPPSPTATPTGFPVTRGVAVEFTDTASFQFATINGSAHSCGSLEGPWEGQAQISFDFRDSQFRYGDFNFGGSGPLQFSGAPQSGVAAGTLTISAIGISEGCTLTSVSDPLIVGVTFSETGDSADIVISSTGAGTLDFTCPGDPPFFGSVPFAAFFSRAHEPVSVPVTPYTGCP